MQITRANRRRLIIAAGAGAIIALLTGFVPNPVETGMKFWGFPYPWISQLDYPGAPEYYHWAYLILDWIILSALAFVLYRSGDSSKTE